MIKNENITCKNTCILFFTTVAQIKQKKISLIKTTKNIHIMITALIKNMRNVIFKRNR